MIGRAIRSLIEVALDLYAGVALIPVIWAQSRRRSYYFRRSSDWLLDRVVTLEGSDDLQTQQMIDAARAEQARRALRATLSGT